MRVKKGKLLVKRSTREIKKKRIEREDKILSCFSTPSTAATKRCEYATTSSAMTLGLAKNGKNGMGVELFMSIEKRGPRPNAVTFVRVLTAHGKIKIFGITLMVRPYGKLLASFEVVVGRT